MKVRSSFVKLASKVFIVFIVGFVSRLLINNIYVLNVFLELSETLCLVCCAMISFFVRGLEYNIIPIFVINFAVCLLNFIIRFIGFPISFLSKSFKGLLKFSSKVTIEALKLSSIKKAFSNIINGLENKDKITINSDSFDNKLLHNTGSKDKQKYSNVLFKGDKLTGSSAKSKGQSAALNALQGYKGNKDRQSAAIGGLYEDSNIGKEGRTERFINKKHKQPLHQEGRSVNQSLQNPATVAELDSRPISGGRIGGLGDGLEGRAIVSQHTPDQPVYRPYRPPRVESDTVEYRPYRPPRVESDTVNYSPYRPQPAELDGRAVYGNTSQRVEPEKRSVVENRNRNQIQQSTNIYENIITKPIDQVSQFSDSTKLGEIYHMDDSTVNGFARQHNNAYYENTNTPTTFKTSWKNKIKFSLNSWKSSKK